MHFRLSLHAAKLAHLSRMSTIAVVQNTTYVRSRHPVDILPSSALRPDMCHPDLFLCNADRDALLRVSNHGRQDDIVVLTIIACQMRLLTMEAGSRGLFPLRSLRRLVLVLCRSIDI